MSRRRYEDRIPRCARCYRALGLDDSPISCNRCNREDEERDEVLVGVALIDVLREGIEHPLNPAESESLLRRVLETMRNAAAKRGDEKTAAALDGKNADALIAKALAARAAMETGKTSEVTKEEKEKA